MDCQNDPKLKKLMDLFPTKKNGCIKQNKIIYAPKENNISTEILKYLTESPSQKKRTEKNNKGSIDGSQQQDTKNISWLRHC